MLLDEDAMRVVLHDVGLMRSAREIESWASWMLGQTWKQRTRIRAFTEVDYMVVMGQPLIGMIAGVGGQRARKALTAIALLDRGPLGRYAGAVALTMPGWKSVPRWLPEIGQARITGAHEASLFPGERTFLFDLRRPSGDGYTLLVSVNERGQAVELDLAEPIEAGEWAGEFVAIDPCEAARVARQAVAHTDADPRVDVNPEFADNRATVLARLIDLSP
jgi:hypothetical protein